MLQAPTLRELYGQAAAALAEVMCVGTRPAAGAQAHDMQIEARDAAAVLVDWLDELIFQVEQTGLVYPAPEIRSASGQRLHASVRGEEPIEWKTPVKAATFHDLRVEEGDDGYRAVVVVDV